MSELSRLKWRCRRGMKELDVLFEKYLAQHYPHVSAEEQAAFRGVLEMDDPDIYAICVRRMAPPAEYQAVFDRLKVEL